jgi:SAM-dependent methyltransferase
MIHDAEKFRNFELAGWQEIPTGYHDAFGPLTSQAIAPLLKAVRLKKGMSFLDIASGPGYVAAAAAKRGATVLGIDFSAAMVAHARRIHSGVEFREGDAEELPCGNDLFDAAAMNSVSCTLVRRKKLCSKPAVYCAPAADLLSRCGPSRRKPSALALSCAPSNCMANRASSCPRGRRSFVTAILMSVHGA